MHSYPFQRGIILSVQGTPLPICYHFLVKPALTAECIRAAIEGGQPLLAASLLLTAQRCVCLFGVCFRAKSLSHGLLACLLSCQVLSELLRTDTIFCILYSARPM